MNSLQQMNTMPNEYEQPFETSKRLSSNSKRKTFNRIQMYPFLPTRYSKANNDHSQHVNHHIVRSQQLQKKQESRQVKQYLSTQSDENQLNLLKLMQEQLQMCRKTYEEKMKEQLKFSSMQLCTQRREVAKLQNIINSNNEVLIQKDRQINELSKMLMNNGHSPPQNVSFIHKKINDCEIKLNVLAENQDRLRQSIIKMNANIEKAEKGFVKLCACKLAILEKKISTYAENSNGKLFKFDEIISQFHKKTQNQDQLSYQNNAIIQRMKLLYENYNSLKDQFKNFHTKQIKYENSNFHHIQQRLSSLLTVTEMLEKKILQRNSENKHTKKKIDSMFRSSGKKNTEPRVNQWSISQFSDYERVYEEPDSIDEDKFFYQTQKNRPFFQQNESFESFSDEEEEESENEKRLVKTIKDRHYEFPLKVKKDSKGKLIVKDEGIYLLDKKMKDFQFSELELTRLQHKGYIIFMH